MYEDKRIALIASFLMAVLWEHLFNTVRFHIDILALFTGLLAIYVFWKGYEKKEKIFGKINPNWAIPLTVILSILTYTVRRGYFLFAIFFLAYMLSTKKFTELIKDKYNWIALVLGLILFFSAENLIFISRIQGVSETYFHPENKINLLPLGVFTHYFSSSISIPSVLFYLYWAGFFIVICNIFLSLGYLKKFTKAAARPDLFNMITILITLMFFIFVIRTPHVFGEGRWFFPLALGAFVCISRSAILLTDFIKKYNETLAFSALLLLIGLGGYYEIVQSDSIIRNKLGTYEGIRQASLYIKEISSQEELVVSIAVPQVVYYAEMDVIQPDKVAGWTGVGEELPLDDFLEGLKDYPQAKYLLISFLEIANPPWMTTRALQNGQIAALEIPFMDTKIDFVNNIQDIKQEKSYGDITFRLLNIKQEVLIYQIERR